MPESTKRGFLVLAGGLLGMAAGLVPRSPAQAHGQLAAMTAATFRCTTTGPLPKGTDAALENTPLWKQVISHLLVNRDRTNPCFAYSDQESWTRVLARIPVNVVGIQVTQDAKEAIIYVTGVPDYRVEMPTVFSGFKPGLSYAIYRIAAQPVPDDRAVHDRSSRGTIGIFVNGASIFNYTDTFSYGNTGLWCYDANVAEASIVNSDIAHATPSNLPQFPKSRGIFHNHQVSALLLHQLQDPFVLGRMEPSKLLGFAIDSNPIYGPIGYTSKDRSSGLKVLKSSYVPRTWLAANGGTGNRSSMPGWVVVNWDGSQVAGSRLLNLFEKNKSDVLYADGKADGPVSYDGTDARLAAELAALRDSVGLKRDAAGYVYWESPVALPRGGTVLAKNYLLKSSDLWGPAFDARILPASYQIADPDKFLFEAKLGSFAEDYDYVPGYGDLDFYNGIDSYLPDRGTHAYHYVTPFSAGIQDEKRMDTASFPYCVGIQYKSRVHPFNSDLENSGRIEYFAKHADTLRTVFDLGVVGKGEDGRIINGSVITTWRQKLTED